MPNSLNYELARKASNVTTKNASYRNEPFLKMFKSNKEHIAKTACQGKKADKSFQCGQAQRVSFNVIIAQHDETNKAILVVRFSQPQPFTWLYDLG